MSTGKGHVIDDVKYDANRSHCPLLSRHFMAQVNLQDLSIVVNRGIVGILA